MNYLIRLLSLIAIISIASSLHAQDAKRRAGYKEYNYKGLRYGLFTPAGYDAQKQYPLVVYLHGSRDTVSRDMNIYQPAVQTQYPCFVLTPKCENPDQGWGNTWTNTHTPSTTKTLALTDSLVKQYSIDKDRLYLFGISMGGFGVFSILAKEQGKFAAAYAICGGSNTAAAGKLLDTPLWIFHGADDDVVPVYLSRDVYNEIVKLGGKKAHYTEYPGVKHNSWENVAREGSLMGWLFSQRKKK
jgi:predicted peptidase